MGWWSQSKPLTEKSRGLLKQNPELAGYPVRAAVFGIVAGAIPFIAGAALAAVGEDQVALQVAGGVLIFLGVLIGSSVAMLEMGALVVAVDRLLHGQAAPKDECRAQAREHTGSLVGWALLNLIVGTIIQAIQGGGDNGIAVTILRTVLAAAAAAAWALITFFMLPMIVLEGLGTFAALKASAKLIKERFGTTVTGGIRIGFRYFLTLILPGLLLIVGGVVLFVAVDSGVGYGFGALAVAAGLVLVLVGSIMTTTVRNIFGVALYRWASSGELVGPFTEAELASAVKQKKQKS